jgi:protein farnesyltransferase subunit beta
VLSEELTAGTAAWIASCQTYEGGLGGEPGLEAHGGYTFCGTAALALLGAVDHLDTGRLLRWLASCQKRLEGGFHGRTNKLVDGCYSFWQGATFAVVDEAARAGAPAEPPSALLAGLQAVDGSWLFDQEALQDYLLVCGQLERGGMRDKPGKEPDFYHTCYCLSGLAVAQHSGPPGAERLTLSPHGEDALLRRIDVRFNITQDKVERARCFFAALPSCT